MVRDMETHIAGEAERTVRAVPDSVTKRNKKSISADKVNASELLRSRREIAKRAVEDHFEAESNYTHADNRVT